MNKTGKQTMFVFSKKTHQKALQINWNLNVSSIHSLLTLKTALVPDYSVKLAKKKKVSTWSDTVHISDLLLLPDLYVEIETILLTAAWLKICWEISIKNWDSALQNMRCISFEIHSVLKLYEQLKSIVVVTSTHN